MTKPQTLRTPEELFNEATEGQDLSSGDLSLLTSGFLALRKTNEKTVNDAELKALYGMIAYVGYNQEVDEETVCSVLSSHYGIETVRSLPSRLYQNAIEYLVDLEMKKIVN
ncbi:MAG TPA: hypothetical protein DCY07_00795 [Rhodospirillaceae bacterium]|nr:hypothetical protein [Rhodospirillaceae bacterium]